MIGNTAPKVQCGDPWGECMIIKGPEMVFAIVLRIVKSKLWVVSNPGSD